MCGISEKGRLLFLCFLLTGLCMSTYAQMSDEAVVKYALEGTVRQEQPTESYSELYR